MQVSNLWDRELTTDDSLIILRDLALSHARRAGAIGRPIADMIESSDYVGLCNYDLKLNDPSWARHLSELIDLRQALGFFTKFENLDIGIDKEKAAYVKFVEAEQECKQVNDLFRGFVGGSISFPPYVIRQLHDAKRKIHRILGRCPQIEDLKLVFGPGATTSIKKRFSCPQNKMADGFKCSDNLLHSGLIPSIIREIPHWADALSSDYSICEDGYLVQWHSVDLHPGRLEFVPKNAKTYRAIVVEPVLNGLLQAGIGSYMARRLRIAGIDIKDQTKNKQLARSASISGAWATLDLSSASDTISRLLVKYLVPEDWYTLLNAARSAEVSYQSETFVLEKFSSMGNGFTFPLETLLFWALTVSASGRPEDVGVYGDDIICPADKAEDVIRLLAFCGFSTNKEKSFITGPFRESCGGDYYLGVDIRPYYQKHLVSGETLFTLHNRYYESYDFEMADAVKNYIPRDLRIYGPSGYGDGHLLSDDFPRLMKEKLLQKGYRGFHFETYTKGKRSSINRFPGDWVSPLYSVYVNDRAPLSPYLNPDVYNESSEAETTKGGRPVWTLPGSDGYKRISIYTFTP